MPAGRPTKYNELTMEVAENYLQHHTDFGDLVPSNEGLSAVLCINSDTLYDWAKDPEKPAFSEMLRRIKDTQRRLLIAKGLSGEFNSAITKLILTKHGYSDKTEVDQKITIHEKTIDDLE